MSLSKTKAAAEALELAERLGFDEDGVEQLADMLKTSWGQSKVQHAAQ